MRATASFLFAVSQRSVHFVTAHSLQTLARMPTPRYLTANGFPPSAKCILDILCGQYFVVTDELVEHLRSHIF